MNRATLFAVQWLIEKAECPPVITLEQVPGLLSKKHGFSFRLLINQFISAGPGYNVRWKIMDFRRFGVMAKRRRLVIIASK